MEMDTQAHWERVYGTKAPNEVSWFRPHLETSLSLIERVAGDRLASIIDVGGGESTLVDDLIVTRKQLGVDIPASSSLRGSSVPLKRCA